MEYRGFIGKCVFFYLGWEEEGEREGVRVRFRERNIGMERGLKNKIEDLERVEKEMLRNGVRGD